MSTRSNKNKAVKFQNETRDSIISKLKLNPNDIRTQTMGAPGDDIILAQAARKEFPYAIECKRQERLSVRAWLDQAYTRKEDDLLPAVVFRQNYCPSFIILEFEKFLDVLAENQKLKNDLKKLKKADNASNKKTKKSETPILHTSRRKRRKKRRTPPPEH